MSCGASHMEEVKAAVKLINKYHNKLIILYCRTSYPLKEKLANLSTISDLKNKFKNNFIGYSDHTNDNNTSIIASILGAKIIEKHFIIDNKKTFDSKFSIKPQELFELIKCNNENCILPNINRFTSTRRLQKIYRLL